MRVLTNSGESGSILRHIEKGCAGLDPPLLFKAFITAPLFCCAVFLWLDVREHPWVRRFLNAVGSIPFVRPPELDPSSGWYLQHLVE